MGFVVDRVTLIKVLFSLDYFPLSPVSIISPDLLTRAFISQ